MRAFCASLVLVGFALLPARAGDVVIEGAEKPVPANTFALLTVKLEKGDKVSWIVFPSPGRKHDHDRELILNGPPGTKYTVIATVFNAGKAEGTAERFDQGQVELAMEGQAPKPAPTPNPKPPGPAPDDGVLGLKGVSRTNAPDDPAGKKAVADFNRGHASALAAGGAGLKNGKFDQDSAVAEWKAGNTAAVGANKAIWIPWGVAINAKLNELLRTGKLADKAGWSQAFNEIADGLDP